MDAHPDDIRPAGTRATLAEDVLLALFQPDSGTIAGEGTLFYVLGGAVLTELAQTGGVVIEDRGALRGRRARAVPEAAPTDDLLRATWDYVAEKPRDVQTVLAAQGPPLRGPLLDRLVERGDVRRRTGKALGIFPTEALSEGDTGRRAEIMSRVRAVLVDGAAPDAATASLIALLSASGSLPVLHREIPWNTAVVTRAKALESGDWGAEAAGEAVTRTMSAIVVGSVVAAMAAASTLPRS